MRLVGPETTGSNRLGDNTPGEHRLADTLADLDSEIADLEARKAAARTRAERRPINKRLHYLRHIVASVSAMGGGTIRRHAREKILDR